MDQTNEVIQPGQPGTAAPSAPVTPAPEIPSGSTQPVQPVQQDADAQAAAEAIRRRQQSANDKEVAEIAKAIKTLKEAGLNVTAEQVLQMRSAQAAQLSGNVSPQPAQEAAQPNVPGTAPEQTSDPVIRKAFSIMETEGGKRLEASDPEFAIIDSKTDDPELFLASVHKAAEAYAKRTGNLSNPARIPTLAGGASPHTPNYANTPGVDILEEYNKAHPL